MDRGARSNRGRQLTPKPQRALAAVVLAAGEGKRFRSSLPKVLHDLCGRPLVAPILDTVAALKPECTVVVVGRGREQVEAAITRQVTLAYQPKQLGTADAARAGDEALGDFDGDVLVVPGDTPLMTAATFKRLVGHHRKTKAAATVLTAVFDDPTGYGRVIRNKDGVERIVEHGDANAAERRITEINAGAYVFDRAALRTALTKVERANKQSEFYLTDVIAILRDKGERIAALPTDDPDEVLGVNSRAQLAAVATKIRARINARHMEAGVTIVDPAQTTIDATVRIGKDTIIHPVTFLTGSTVIGAGCEIGPNVRMKDSRVESKARVQFAVVDQARIGPGATVGPFAYLRPGTVVGRKAKVGTFVEVKASTIGEGSKVPHLSYIGDATIGRDVNVGAATVTLNYDSETKKKSRTVIGDEAKIGGDTMLVAPVRVGRRAVTGAASVVTRDVPPNTVVWGAPARPKRKRKTLPRGGAK